MDPSEGKRSHRHHLQNILSHRLVGAFRRLRNGKGTLASDAAAGGGGGSGSGYRTGTLTYNAYAADACSTLSMPASYSASYYTDDFSSVHGGGGGDTTSVITISDLDREHRHTGSSRRNRRRRNIDSLEYPEYANMETFKQCLGSDRKHSASGSADVTPTNGRATLKPSPDGGIMNEDYRAMTRLRSMRDTERRMRSVMQVPSYILTASELEADDDSRLGFANIPDQMHRKAVKKGFNFTLMIAGESGLGKATLVNSLFMQDLYKDREEVDANERIHKVTKIEKRQIELDERGVKLRLTIVDTPGFNDAVNAEECWKPIEDYIDGTFEQYFKDECGLNRKNIQDNRVHCCLYFISPYGHGLRQVDVEFMRHLQNKVNIVPVIAKADALTAAELRDLKDRIMSDLDRYKIDIYRLPECDSDEEEEIKRLDKEIKAVLPFAVIGSNCVIEGEGGKRVRGRQYPWGVVEVENPRHCDFTKLRIFLLKTHMQDLKDMTLEVHYENYRAKYITERMSKRQTDRREAGGAHRTDRENGPGFDAIVDADCLLRQKEEELQRLQHSGAKTLDLTARAKNPDASSLHSNGAGQNPAQSNTVSSTRSAISGPGTLPPKATATGL